MKVALPYTPFIPSPEVLSDSGPRPVTVASLTIKQICKLARIPMRATSPHTPAVRLHPGSRHFRAPDAYYVGIGRPRFSRRPQDSLRVLEVLAHGFHDYVARETICGRALFVPPRRRGRPALLGRRMSAAERMRRMRTRRRDTKS